MEQLIRVAIRERRLLEFVLHGLRRIAEPHLLGIRHGTRQVLVYQVAGQSRSGRLPGWRTADLGTITHLRVLDLQFDMARLGPNDIAGWDEVLEKVR